MIIRTRYLLAWTSIAVLVGWAVGCGSDSEDPVAAAGNGGSGGSEDASTDVLAEAGDDLPAPICNQGARWTAGTKAFVESTKAWGLDQPLIDGTRLAAVDYDGDGWPDLMVRQAASIADNFADGGVRTTWLLRNTGKKGFEDTTESSGLRKNRTETDATKGRPGQVIAFGDVDNDGDLDAFTGAAYDAKNPTPETSELMLNKGDGTFELGPADSPLRAPPDPEVSQPASASWVDFDRDGNLDIWIPQTADNGSPQQDRLYKGDGKGGFVDVTIERGLETLQWLTSTSVSDMNDGKGHTYTWSGAACDLNNDGDPELLTSSYARSPNHLWQSSGAAGGYKFTNRSVASGYAYDDQQDWSDNESARCWCKLHPSDTGCAGVPPPQYIPCAKDADAFRWSHDTDRDPWRLGGNSGATMCADIDNDGWMDLMTTEIVHGDVGSSSDRAELLMNAKEKDVRFTRPGLDAMGLKREHSGINWNEGIMTGAVFDFDNDGWPDVYFGDSDYPNTRGLLYHQDAPGHFEAVPLTDGISSRRSHGIAVADFDHDGDLDVVVGHSRARCDTDCYPTGQIRFFENVMGQGGNFVQLTLSGKAGTNRAAIGARVTLTAGGVTQTKDVGGGHGHFNAQDDLTLHFGLGTACDAQVTVRWPDAALTTEQFKVVAGYRFSIEQGGKPKVVWPKP
ncbi:MAG: CRTAC1 family protein [Deltaproteobacteria bacterium]|nr:CRTAC1 family protein [Deltaproteobacteria bacterium]